MSEFGDFRDDGQQHLLLGYYNPYPEENILRKIAVDVDVRAYVSSRTGNSLASDAEGYYRDRLVSHISEKRGLTASDTAVILECSADRAAQAQEIVGAGIFAYIGSQAAVERLTDRLCNVLLPPLNSTTERIRRAAHANQARLL